MPSITYLVAIGEREREVALRVDGAQLLARVDGGPEQPVDLLHTARYQAVLRLGDAFIPVLLRPTQDGAEVVLGGRVFTPRVTAARIARLRRLTERDRPTSIRREDLRAPMSGLVVRVLCAAGHQVQPGQSLVVLQAMKMENELSLPRGGTVRSVAVAPGETVEQNQLLVEIE